MTHSNPYIMKQKILNALLLLFCATNIFAQKEVRLKENFDFDWKFSLSDQTKYADKNYDDQAWETIQLPHDWNIKQDFVREQGGSAAYLPEGIGWYRKTFRVPASYKEKHISVLFDGIFMQSDVYINGKHLGFRPYGFCSIEYDLTPHLRFNEDNVIAVRVNTTGGRPRWYAGAGIYRHTWLQVANPVHIATYGTYITTPSVSNKKADINMVTTLKNITGKEQMLSDAAITSLRQNFWICATEWGSLSLTKHSINGNPDITENILMNGGKKTLKTWYLETATTPVSYYGVSVMKCRRLGMVVTKGLTVPKCCKTSFTNMSQAARLP